MFFSSAPKLQPVYETVVIFCPGNIITGGPEALHQVAYTINQQGGNAVMGYFGQGSEIDFSPERLAFATNLKPHAIAEYERYQPRTSPEVPLNKNCLLVFPEILTPHLGQVHGVQKAIWWLSVDNAMQYNPALNGSGEDDKIFPTKDVLHFYQSDYAKAFLEKRQARRTLPLFDYIRPSYFDKPVARDKKEDIITYFPRKGGAIAQAFIDKYPQFKFVPIHNMFHEDVVKTLRRSKIFIDFGHHPGKDRVPREAAASGNVVYLHKVGAATHYRDHCIDPDFLFAGDEVTSGTLAQKIADTLANYDAHMESQTTYRQNIYLEQEEFNLQVRQAFFKYD